MCNIAGGVDSPEAGTGEGRVSFCAIDVAPLTFGCISPRAVVILLVNDDIAHPAQDVSPELPILVEVGFVVLAASVVGNAVWAMTAPCFRTRRR